MNKNVTFFTVFFGILPGILAGQENRTHKIQWEKIRAGFAAYADSPSADNAKRLLSVLPKEFDNATEDYQQWTSTFDSIWLGKPMTVLTEMVRKGDKLSIRVAFRTIIISDGAFTEDLCSLLGESIRVNPIGFLEAAKLFNIVPALSIDQKDHLLGSILAGFIDFDEFRPAVIEKELQLRIDSLGRINRADLRQIRDVCLDLLKKHLHEIRG